MENCDAITWARPTPKVPAVERDPWRLLADNAQAHAVISGAPCSKSMPFSAKPAFPPHPPPVPAAEASASLATGSSGAQPVLRCGALSSDGSNPDLDPSSGFLSPEPAEVSCPRPPLDLERACDSPDKTGGKEGDDASEPDPVFQALSEDTPFPLGGLLCAELDSSDGSKAYADSYQDLGEADLGEADWPPEGASWSVVSGGGLSLSAPASVPNVCAISEGIAAALADSCAHLKLPWETGAYKDLFASDPMSGFSPASVFEPWRGEVPSSSSGPLDLGESSGSLPSSKQVSVSAGKIFLDVPDMPYEARVAKIKEEALIKMVAFITALRKQDRPLGWPEQYPDQLETVSACVGVKSPFTLEKRANSLNVFLRWAAKNNCVSAILSESTLWAFLKTSKKDGSPASRLLGVASGLRFSQHILGLERAGEALSKRCLGLLSQMEASSVPRGQADPLLVTDVLKVHAALRNKNSSPWDRASAGYLMTCLYARARASDFLRVSHVEFDDHGEDGFLELILKSHKGARSAKRKAQLLPVLAPSKGIDGLPWVQDGFGL